MTKEEMVGWHHLLEGDVIWDLVMDKITKFPGDLAWCSPWGHKDLHMTEQLH